jgi:hypothetical protein
MALVDRFLPCFFMFAQRFFAALEIAALPAADRWPSSRAYCYPTATPHTTEIIYSVQSACKVSEISACTSHFSGLTSSCVDSESLSSRSPTSFAITLFFDDLFGCLLATGGNTSPRGPLSQNNRFMVVASRCRQSGRRRLDPSAGRRPAS